MCIEPGLAALLRVKRESEFGGYFFTLTVKILAEAVVVTITGVLR